MKKRFGSIAIGLALALSLSACGSSGSYSTKNSYDAVAAESYADYDYSDYGYEESYDVAANGGESVDVQENAQSTNRKLIRTANLTVETKEYESFLGLVNSEVNMLGGYIENTNTSNYSYSSSYRSTRHASITARIPSNKLDEFLNQVSESANVTNRQESVEDVTLNYVDLQSHKNALIAEEKQLMNLMERAETIEDLLVIEERLTEVRYQLESMESQIRTYDNKIDYSTVYLEISEVIELTPVEPESVWQRIGREFTENLKSVGEGLVNFFVWFISSIPYLVIWAIIIFVAVKVIKFINKKRKAKKQEKQEKNNIASCTDETNKL